MNTYKIYSKTCGWLLATVSAADTTKALRKYYRDQGMKLCKFDFTIEKTKYSIVKIRG